MVLVGCIGTTIALISFVENILVFYTFVYSKVLRRRNLLYLTCLSLCDIFVSVSYIGIMSMQLKWSFLFRKKTEEYAARSLAGIGTCF
uniref:G_PROTEIN_RECEP_F1_2 domain-containing protein n=1 Tax=Ascaris lumbricoides TaxID=6252 RepID=A0A0M3HKU4_ASCLU